MIYLSSSFSKQIILPWVLALVTFIQTTDITAVGHCYSRLHY